MKFPVAICTVLFTGVLMLQAWTLNTVVDLKADFAALKAIVSQNHNNNVADK